MESWKHAVAVLARDRLASLKRQAFLMTGDEGLAEDLVQEALVRAFARPLRAPRPHAAEAYVRMTMVNLFIDGARSRSRWHQTAPLLVGIDMAADPAEQVASRDAMLTALDKLSPRQRACVVLRYYRDLPLAQIATELGVAEGTVKRHLSDAMTRLAECLSPAGSKGRDDTDGS
jgi:RNA polymerase sigma-70 factor (sigma-E family)